MLDSFKLSNRSKHMDIFPQKGACPALTAHKYLCIYIHSSVSVKLNMLIDNSSGLVHTLLKKSKLLCPYALH